MATPQGAVSSYLGHAPAGKIAGVPGRGFRVWRILRDPALQRQWIWIETCEGPERPARLTWIPLILEKKSLEARSSLAAVDNPMVRLGDGVVVVESGDTLSMRLSGQALEAGELGQKIRVRIAAWRNGAVVIGTIAGKDEIRLSN